MRILKSFPSKMFLALVFVATLLLLLYFKYYATFNYWQRRGVKFEKTQSIFGNIGNNLLQRQSMADLIANIYKKYSEEPYFGIFTFMNPTLVVKDPEIIKEIAVKNIDNFITHKLFSTGDGSQVFSKNLFATSGSIWRNTRPSLSPAFTGSKMRAMYDLVNECSMQWFKTFEAKNEDTVHIDLKEDIIIRFTIDVISTCIFGLKSDSFEDKNNEFFKRAHSVGDFGGKKVFALFGYCIPQFIVKMFDLRIVPADDQQFFERVVLETIKMRLQNNIVRPDMINLLMDSRKGKLTHDADGALNDTGFATIEESNLGKSKGNVEMADDEIVGHSLLFLIAGSDTTACGLTFLIYELALHPEIQQRLYEEIAENLEEGKGKISYENILKMKYLDMVCSETLRKWPPLPVTDRCTSKPYEIQTENKKSLRLETGTVVWFPVFSIHRDPKFYEDPERFDPERFSEENKDKINKDAYLPFGVGPRACIGSRLAMLMFKSILVHILNNFEVVPVEKTPIPLELSKKHIFLNPNSPVWLGLNRRTH